MQTKKPIRNILLGEAVIPSYREYRYAFLRGQLGLLVVMVSFIYIFLDMFDGAPTFIFWNISILIVGLLSLLLNRLRYYTTSSIMLVVLMDSVVYLFAEMSGRYEDYLLFLPCCVISLLLFNYYRKLSGVLVSLVPAILGVLALYTDLIPMRSVSLEESIQEIHFIVNFLVSLGSVILAVSFIVNRNNESETALRNSEQSHIKLSDELKISQERFVLALRGTRAGIYEWDLQKNSIHVSNYWKKLLGYDESELENITIDSFLYMVHPEDREGVSNSIRAFLESHQPYQNELRLRLKDGSYKWFLDSGIFKIDDKGNVITVVGSIIDVDERKNAEAIILQKNEQLAKANEELDRFVYSASHDMRAPLSSLLGLINLTERLDISEELADYLGMMKKRIYTMEGFIKEITEYSRNVRMEVKPTDVSLRPVVLEIVQILSFMVEKKVRTEINVENDFVLRTDFGRLKVILNNLISNAFKYQRLDQKDPFIVIYAHRKLDKAIISIKDNGQGIREEHRDRIFDMFYRASENSEGSGLGLYIVRETIQKLGGSIKVESEPFAGSTFTIIIPDFV